MSGEKSNREVWYVRVTWVDGERQTKYFADSERAQEHVLWLQRKGISPEVRRVKQAEIPGGSGW